MKFVCLNLYQGGELMPGIIDFLQQQDADIVALQEVYEATEAGQTGQYDSLNTLQAALHYPYTDFTPALLDHTPGGKVESGNAVLSKFPIIERNEYRFTPYGERTEWNDEAYKKTPRNLEHVAIDIASTTLNVFNFQGVWNLNGTEDSPERLHMSQVIVDAIKGKRHVILCGDTNVQPETETIRRIEQAGLRNIFKGELTTSFNMRRKDNPGYATAVVDMIFVSPGIRVLEHDCPDVDVSDHFPLTMTFDIG